ncbi:3-dehydroquinate synthase [Sphingomonas sp. PP-F2F-G114-C0414]|uniref:3-dehydroquinate synthase n=1 Tax=Sphingomonas sp. PP-F2F-G114-C0414 TaxID=2135662 RepID=UPI000EF9306A|nr:3-dehydroquinate synthase [Sphingomonas sp. PP-F2F-G114-C0414]RMB37371.1 3-dehydroquinate synthase [Sphingomonas sp. PP-F2F-G114-C0414]
MKTVIVELGSRTYPIHIEAGILARAGEFLAPLAKGRRVAIVTDENLSVHLATLQASLTAAGIASEAIVLAPGEGSKSWATLEMLCDRLLELGVERGDHVVALGGGVMGDLVGFACSILKRGCNFVQIPTSLLAQVDSSVGGKTAINTKAGKNLIGAFHQPVMVLIDPQVLDTLPIRELRAGYAEVVKYGLIDDFVFFEWCEANGAALLAGDIRLREYAIAHSVSAKARIVAADEHETNGTRALLNLGHTFGHALEAETGFSQALIHGEGVAAGCSLAFGFSAAQGICSVQVAERVAAHLRDVGLPDGLAAAKIGASGARLVDHMRHDKKMAAGTLPFLLARGIGQTYLDKTVDLGDVETFLDAQPR